MEVNLNSKPSQLTDYSQSVPARAAGSAAASPAETDSTMSFERTKALEETLRQSSSVRSDKVAQAKALVSDPNYPSDDVLSRMSDLLASHLANS
jgi:hypothetical protein